VIKFKPLTDKVEWDWVRTRAHPIACSDSQGIVAYDDRGIQAVCVADSFTVDACSVHFAIDSPFAIRSGFFNEVARHLFIECDRKKIFGLVPASNKKAIKLDTHMGFKEVARIPDAYAEGVDYIVLRMDRKTSRWLSDEQKEAA
jgi:hypothetical protein